MISLEEARARGIALPTDDTVAQDIIDEQEAWLARFLGGPLEGSRTETFYVGLSQTAGKLALARHTDAVTVVDGGTSLAAGRIRLVDRGSAVLRSEDELTPWWTGPYVAVTYQPNDADEVRAVLFDLCALKGAPAERHSSEQIGAYSYSGGGVASTGAARRNLAGTLVPRRDPSMTIRAVSRRVSADDPVINRAEPLT